jgi:LAGLIDADG-like domain
MDRDPRGGHNRKRVNEDYFKKWSPQMAYVLGFIYADGAVEDCRESSRTCYVSIANNDHHLLEQIRTEMSSDHEIYHIKKRLMRIGGKSYTCKDSYCLRIGNKIMYQDLINLGLCPRKSLIIELPEVPNQYFEYFLRGYFDGDGCINIEKVKKNRMNIIFTSGSRIFLEQLVNKVQSIFPTIRSSISFGHGAFKLRYNWRNALMVAECMYKDIEATPYLRYKHDKYIDYLSVRR